MRKLEKYVSYIPILLFISETLAIISHYTGFWRYISFYYSQILGHSIITLLFLLYYAWRHKYCLYLKTLIVGCMVIDISNIFLIKNKEDYWIYHITLYAVILCLVIYTIIKNAYLQKLIDGWTHRE